MVIGPSVSVVVFVCVFVLVCVLLFCCVLFCVCLCLFVCVCVSVCFDVCSIFCDGGPYDRWIKMTEMNSIFLSRWVAAAPRSRAIPSPLDALRGVGFSQGLKRSPRVGAFCLGNVQGAHTAWESIGEQALQNA